MRSSHPRRCKELVVAEVLEAAVAAVGTAAAALEAVETVGAVMVDDVEALAAQQVTVTYHTRPQSSDILQSYLAG